MQAGNAANPGACAARRVQCSRHNVKQKPRAVNFVHLSYAEKTLLPHAHCLVPVQSARISSRAFATNIEAQAPVRRRMSHAVGALPCLTTKITAPFSALQPAHDVLAHVYHPCFGVSHSRSCAR